MTSLPAIGSTAWVQLCNRDAPSTSFESFFERLYPCIKCYYRLYILYIHSWFFLIYISSIEMTRSISPLKFLNPNFLLPFNQIHYSSINIFSLKELDHTIRFFGFQLYFAKNDFKSAHIEISISKLQELSAYCVTLLVLPYNPEILPTGLQDF